MVNFYKNQFFRCFYLLSHFKNALNPKPSSTRLYSSITSNGSGSVRSIMGPICQSLIRGDGKIRSFWVSSSEFENVVVEICENALNPEPASTRLYSSITSNGSGSVRSIRGPICCSLIRGNGKIRSFSVCSSEFENVVAAGSEDSVLKVSRIDENVSKDKIFKDGSVLNDENLSDVSSKVINVAEIPLSELFGKKAERNDSKLVYEIVEAIRNCKDKKLGKEIIPKDEKSPTRLVHDVFRVLSREKVSGLPFVTWAKDENLKLFYRADFRSLIIDNCGWLEDYDTMQRLLEGFSAHDFALTEKAFGFLAGFGGDKDLTMVSISKVVVILNKIGGSCRGTGLSGMIKTLCKVDLVDLAMFVIQITGKKLSFYNIIVLEMCLRSRFDEANDLLEEMRESNCGPDVLSYTYILSTLCRNDKTKEACDLLEEMEKKGCEHDSLIFEIIILHMCKLGKMDIASQYFVQMVSEGLVPRVNTYNALIKCYFNSENHVEAHKFVSKLGVEHKSCGTSAYNLLASLHYGKKEVVTAGNLLTEMMDKNFIPQFTLYKNISKQLLKIGDKKLASDIKAKFSKLRIQSNTAEEEEKRVT